MKYLFVCILLALCLAASSQQITCTVTDANTGAPLAYATIIFKASNEFFYTDSLGEFSFSKNEIKEGDSIMVQYVSYATLTLPASRLADGIDIKLHPEINQLANVTVTACNNLKTITINKIRGKAKDYLGPGPEMRIIIITRFTNDENLTGFIREIEFYSGSFTEKAQVPVRIHWYKWDTTSNMPAEEITTTNIIVYPNHKGWNKFSVPAKTIFYPDEGVVLGLEFIYPVEYKKQYASFADDKQKIDWLNDMNHRWSLGMQTTVSGENGTFFIMNNEAVAAYSKKNDYRYLKPAMRIAIETCKQ